MKWNFDAKLKSLFPSQSLITTLYISLIPFLFLYLFHKHRHTHSQAHSHLPFSLALPNKSLARNTSWEIPLAVFAKPDSSQHFKRRKTTFYEKSCCCSYCQVVKPAINLNCWHFLHDKKSITFKNDNVKSFFLILKTLKFTWL